MLAALAACAPKFDAAMRLADELQGAELGPDAGFETQWEYGLSLAMAESVREGAARPIIGLAVYALAAGGRLQFSRFWDRTPRVLTPTARSVIMDAGVRETVDELQRRAWAPMESLFVDTAARIVDATRIGLHQTEMLDAIAAYIATMNGGIVVPQPPRKYAGRTKRMAMGKKKPA